MREGAVAEEGHCPGWDRIQNGLSAVANQPSSDYLDSSVDPVFDLELDADVAHGLDSACECRVQAVTVRPRVCWVEKGCLIVTTGAEIAATAVVASDLGVALGEAGLEIPTPQAAAAGL